MGVGSLYRLAVIGVGGVGQELVNVMHYRQLTPKVTPLDTQDLAEVWAQNMTDFFAATFAESNGITRLEVRGVTDPTEGYDYSYPALVPGTRVSAQILPPQSAAVITWTTGLVGRRYRGRNYMWYTVEDDQNQGTFSADYRTALDAYASAALVLEGAPDFASFDLCVYSKPNPDLDPPWGGAITPVTSYIVRNLVYTQRRRRVGVGS
jgi:hypothetical protein